MRGGTIVMCMVSSEAPTTDLPQRAVILIVVGRVFVALKAVREGSGRPRPLALLSRKEVEASLWNCPTFKTVATIFVNPF
jgi:hypothetical protein